MRFSFVHIADALGSPLPKGYRDARFLRDCLQSLLGCDSHQLTLIGGVSGEPICLRYGDAVDGLPALTIFPIDLARYPQQRLAGWVARNRGRRVIALHERSVEALRRAGFDGEIEQLPLPFLAPRPVSASDALQLARVFRCLDSRGRHYDPEWLIPSHCQAADETVATSPALAEPASSPPRPSWRFRLGATKRHCLNLLDEWRAPPAAPAEPAAAPGTQPISLRFDGPVFTLVLDEFNVESCWADIVKAFCHAFRQQPDATLLLLLLNDADEQHARDFDHVLCGLSPFACRPLLVQAALDESDYRAVIACSDVYLEAGRRDTLLPHLRCFAAAGVPTIGYLPRERKADAPAIDYPLAYCHEPAACDFSDDPRYATEARRLDWDGLVTALGRAHADITARRGNGRVARAAHADDIERQQMLWRQALRGAAAHA